MFQPVGGMDMIGKAFAKQVGDLIRYNAKVTRIRQNDSGVTVSLRGHRRSVRRAAGEEPIGASAPFRCRS